MDVGRVRLRRAGRQRRHRQLDDAAEEEPGRRRAGARQGGHRDRPAGRPAGHAQGAAAGLQPRPAGGQAGRVRPGRRPAGRAGRACTVCVAGLRFDRRADGGGRRRRHDGRHRRGRAAGARGHAVPPGARSRWRRRWRPASGSTGPPPSEAAAGAAAAAGAGGPAARAAAAEVRRCERAARVRAASRADGWCSAASRPPSWPREYGTPLYVYCARTLRERGRRLPGAGSSWYPGAARAVFACKANATVGGAAGGVRRRGWAPTWPRRASWRRRCGRAPIPASMVVHGNNKSDADLRGGDRGRAPGWSSSTTPASSSRSSGWRPPPDACSGCWCGSRRASSADTHAKIVHRRTPAPSSGCAPADALDALDAAAGAAAPAAVPACTCIWARRSATSRPYVQAVDWLVEFIEEHGLGDLPVLDLGGGFGDRPHRGRDGAGDRAGAVEQIALHLAERLIAHGLSMPELILEPGRSIVGPGRRHAVRRGRGQEHGRRHHLRGGRRRHVRQPAAGAVRRPLRGDRLRPRRRRPRRRTYAIAGKHCESGDVLIERVRAPGAACRRPAGGARDRRLRRQHGVELQPACRGRGGDGRGRPRPRRDVQRRETSAPTCSAVELGWRPAGRVRAARHGSRACRTSKVRPARWGRGSVERWTCANSFRPVSLGRDHGTPAKDRPRAIWTGSISFGLVNAPVRMYAADQRAEPEVQPDPREGRRADRLPEDLQARGQAGAQRRDRQGLPGRGGRVRLPAPTRISRPLARGVQDDHHPRLRAADGDRPDLLRAHLLPGPRREDRRAGVRAAGARRWRGPAWPRWPPTSSTSARTSAACASATAC